MPLRFGEWLHGQQDRTDEIGNLARVPAMQMVIQGQPGRKLDEHKAWANIVIRIVEPGLVAIFNAAWQEFLLARQQAEEAAA
jgi:hypothetical protein